MGEGCPYMCRLNEIERRRIRNKCGSLEGRETFWNEIKISLSNFSKTVSSLKPFSYLSTPFYLQSCLASKWFRGPTQM